MSDKEGALWNIEDESFKGNQSRNISIPNPLPSDSRYREDLLWVKKKNLQNAEQWKYWLEE